MKFQDVFVSREHMFSVGIEKESGRFYVSIPVSNGMVDYENIMKLIGQLLNCSSVTRTLLYRSSCVVASASWTSCC